MTLISELQKRIHHEIPMSSYMKVRVKEASIDSVSLEAPLAPNINHKSTAFGGSVHSLAVLSCWALMNVILTELEKEGVPTDYVVIQDSQIDYQLPIDSDFTATAAWTSEAAREKFLLTLRKRGLARVSIKSEVSNSKRETCAALEARFVAQKR